jgi:murein DD-endopeptidase MepM/ murein hydrolase activator NlpD
MRFIKDIFRGNYPITQKFNDPDTKHYYNPMGLAGHNGIDFGTPIGTDALAGVIGTVTVVEDQGDNGYGKSVVVVTKLEGRTFELRWAHLNDVEHNLKIGVQVWSETIIGECGNSGFCVTSGHKVTPEERAAGKGAH